MRRAKDRLRIENATEDITFQKKNNQSIQSIDIQKGDCKEPWSQQWGIYTWKSSYGLIKKRTKRKGTFFCCCLRNTSWRYPGTYRQWRNPEIIRGFASLTSYPFTQLIQLVSIKYEGISKTTSLTTNEFYNMADFVSFLSIQPVNPPIKYDSEDSDISSFIRKYRIYLGINWLNFTLILPLQKKKN